MAFQCEIENVFEFLFNYSSIKRFSIPYSVLFPFLVFFQFLPVVAASLKVNIADVVLYGADAYIQGFGDFPVAFALLYQIKHFHFLFGKLSVCA